MQEAEPSVLAAKVVVDENGSIPGAVPGAMSAIRTATLSFRRTILNSGVMMFASGFQQRWNRY